MDENKAAETVKAADDFRQRNRITKPEEAKPQVSGVSDAEVEAALQELLHERNSIGDGCFGCGYGGWWGPNTIANNKHRYQEMLKRVLEAARPHQK